MPRRPHKGRLRQLGAIEGLLHAQRQRIPDKIFFRFASSPTTLDDPIPELGEGGENDVYLGVRGILVEHLKQLEAMEEIGDHDLDRRLEVLKDRVRDYLELLERRKADAWSIEVATAVLSNLPVGQGPIPSSPREYCFV